MGLNLECLNVTALILTWRVGISYSVLEWKTNSEVISRSETIFFDAKWRSSWPSSTRRQLENSIKGVTPITRLIEGKHLWTDRMSGRLTFVAAVNSCKQWCLGQSGNFGGGWLSWEMVWWIALMIVMRISVGEKARKGSDHGDSVLGRRLLKIIKNLGLKDCSINRRERWWIYLDYELMRMGMGEKARKGSDHADSGVWKIVLKIIKNLWLKDCWINRRERWWVYLNNNWKIYEIVKVENGMISGDEKWVLKIKSFLMNRLFEIRLGWWMARWKEEIQEN